MDRYRYTTLAGYINVMLNVTHALNGYELRRTLGKRGFASAVDRQAIYGDASFWSPSSKGSLSKPGRRFTRRVARRRFTLQPVARR
jgi:hypothetical protein